MAEPEPHELLFSLTSGSVVASCLQAVADLGVADELVDEPASVEELAARCGADADALARVLRLLAAHGVFALDGGVRHTPASRLLRTDHPMSLRAYVRMYGQPLHARSLAAIDHTLRTGAPATETLDPRGGWAYLQDHPAERKVFDEAMTARAAVDIAAVLDTYDFGRFATIADIGGGRGHLLRAVLDTVPTASGVLFDLPDVIDRLELGHERMTAAAGDFLADPLPRADAYLLMEVLHDWPDAECVRILSAIRAAAPAATVLIVEGVPDDAQPATAALVLDVVMLLLTGGRERTPTEMNRLLHAAGFGTATVVETGGRVRIVEATAA
jgi:C-methyltransferase